MLLISYLIIVINGIFFLENIYLKLAVILITTIQLIFIYYFPNSDILNLYLDSLKIDGVKRSDLYLDLILLITIILPSTNFLLIIPSILFRILKSKRMKNKNINLI